MTYPNADLFSIPTETTYKLVVTVPDERTFNAYWYGFGVLTGVCQVDTDKWEAEIDYGTDKYRCEYQAGRFWSGLYPAEIITSDS